MGPGDLAEGVLGQKMDFSDAGCSNQLLEMEVRKFGRLLGIRKSAIISRGIMWRMRYQY